MVASATGCSLSGPRWTVMAEARGAGLTNALIGAVATIIAAVVATVIASSGDSPASPTVPGPVPTAVSPQPVREPPSVFLSRDSGPAGTEVRVSGEGFAPGERVVLRFHIEQIGSTTADGEGKFSNMTVIIPGSLYSRAAPHQFSVSGSGQSSLQRADAPFTITG